MMPSQTALERAFEMARSGEFTTISEIIAGLRREGHATSQVDGPALRKQLRALIKEALAAKGT